MKHLFVPSGIALMAKEKGFDELCITRWGETSKKLYESWKPLKNSEDGEDFTSAPLYQQLIDWFKKEHELLIRKTSNGLFWELIDLQTCTEGPTNPVLDDLIKEAFKLIK